MRHAIDQTTADYARKLQTLNFGKGSKAPNQYSGFFFSLSHTHIHTYHVVPRGRLLRKSHFAITQAASRPWKQSAR